MCSCRDRIDSVKMMFVARSPSTLVLVLLLTLCLLAPISCRSYVPAADRALLASQLDDMLVAGDDDDPGTSVGRPRRPDSFRTIGELNEYLAEMRQYYSMLGRPR